MIEPWLFEKLRQPAACCPEGGVHYRFIRRYLDFVERPDGLSFLKGYLEAQGPERSGRLLESYSRMVALGLLRHEVLAASRKKTGRPSTILLEAQLALFPECDLGCRGCYSASSRYGSTPDRSTMAYLVDEIADCGAWAIHVVGRGEPFRRGRRIEDLLDVIAARPHLMFSIATNGQWMPESLARRLARLGNVLLLGGVDGQRSAHDARRGAGTHARAMATLETLRRHNLFFAYASMVSRQSIDHVTAPDFIEAMAHGGCALGIYSRYFPLARDSSDELLLTPEATDRYRAAFDRARSSAPIPLLDFDEVEAHTGCRSRAGLTVFVDGVSGVVSPCIRTPFSPSECRLDREKGVRLADILEHPFFHTYRRGKECHESSAGWCGHDPNHELGVLISELAPYGVPDDGLRQYRDRWAVQREAPTVLNHQEIEP
jgi:MoaA/NifB/PqqE/SkfB family radical SAM enzyme